MWSVQTERYLSMFDQIVFLMKDCFERGRSFKITAEFLVATLEYVTLRLIHLEFTHIIVIFEVHQWYWHKTTLIRTRYWNPCDFSLCVIIRKYIRRSQWIVINWTPVIVFAVKGSEIESHNRLNVWWDLEKSIIQETYFSHFDRHCSQNRCPQMVSTGSRRYMKHTEQPRFSCIVNNDDSSETQDS